MKRSQWAAQLGYPEDQWDAARAEVREAILEAARFQRLTTYAEVAAQVAAVPVTPHSPVLAHLLGEVLGDELEQTGLALTALVVHGSDQQPGGGFWREARRDGAVFSDPHEYWARQVKAIFERYGRNEARA